MWPIIAPLGLGISPYSSLTSITSPLYAASVRSYVMCCVNQSFHSISIIPKFLNFDLSGYWGLVPVERLPRKHGGPVLAQVEIFQASYEHQPPFREHGRTIILH